MKILDTANPWAVLSAVGAVVKVQPNVQAEPQPPGTVLVVGTGAGAANSVVTDPANLRYVTSPPYKNLDVTLIVATNTLTILGKTFTCTAGAPANTSEFQYNATPATMAANLVTQANLFFTGITATSPVIPTGTDDAAAMPVFEATGKTTGGAGTTTVVIEGSNDGVVWDATALLSLAVTTSTVRASKIGALTIRPSFIRARITALTGTGGDAQCFMKQ